MYAEEVDLRAVEYLVAHAQLDRDTGNEGNELARLLGAHTHMPLLLPAGCFQGPTRMVSAISSRAGMQHAPVQE